MILWNNGHSKDIVLACYVDPSRCWFWYKPCKKERQNEMHRMRTPQKREGIKGEKQMGKSRGSLSFLSLSNLLFFPSLPSPLDTCHAGKFRRVTKGQMHDKRENQACKVCM